MKKFLILGALLIAITIPFAPTANTFATNLDNQPIEVTVGEVDEVNNNNTQNINAPETGIFGLGSDSELVAISIFLVICALIPLAFLFRYIYRKNTKK